MNNKEIVQACLLRLSLYGFLKFKVEAKKVEVEIGCKDTINYRSSAYYSI